MELYGHGPAAEGSHHNPDTGLEEPMWQLGLGGGGGGRGGRGVQSQYPERPGEPDCAYYLRTGTCSYGERCRYNHPRNRGMVAIAGRIGGDYPDRPGQPACQYFLKTGTCKYGVTCKYDHPRQGGLVRPVSLNYYGYPLRPGEKECSYYVKTGQCKFGSTCKFHHPQPAGAVPSSAPAFYPPVQPASVASWQVARPTMLPTPYVQAPYGSMLISPGVVPVPSWSPYPPTASPVLSPSGQHTVEGGTLYGLSGQLSSSAPSYPGSYPPVSSLAGASSGSRKEHMFPERPGQPECQYYMRTGDCKFGSTCKYHHPPERSLPRTDCQLSLIGLPLRPLAIMKDQEKSGSSGKRSHSKWDTEPGADGEAVAASNVTKKKRKTGWTTDDTQLKMLGPLKLPDFVKGLVYDT